MKRLIPSDARWLRALPPAAALVMSCVAHAQTEPVIIEAESGNVSPTIYNTGAPTRSW